MNPIRAKAVEWAQKTPGAFLRCDRGAFLYVTNAPILGTVGVPEGFIGEVSGELLFLMPADRWIEPFVQWVKPMCADDPLFHDFMRFERRAVDAASCALWLEGLKALELGLSHPARENYERRVRQCAAVTLRTGEGGGVLIACAACLALMDR